MPFEEPDLLADELRTRFRPLCHKEGDPSAVTRRWRGQRRCWHPLLVRSIYEAAGGDEGLLRLAEAWHTRVLADEIVSHAFSAGFRPDHTRRLAAYWSEALGGPPAYSDRYGDETSVVRLHSGNGQHEDMDRRAIACFDLALDDADLAADEALRQALHDYFAWATTTSMASYPESADAVPAGLRIPRWSWNGLQDELGTSDSA